MTEHQSLRFEQVKGFTKEQQVRAVSEWKAVTVVTLQWAKQQIEAEDAMEEIADILGIKP